MKVWQVIVAGVVVHLILFYSIFDIYFTSPLVHGMTPVTARVPAPAKRLVLFVADGLRADKFFEPMENKAFRSPYLRSIIENVGAWGVSHTRVPTESRPGHVALIAGFYEDVSAVAKGWKENPVEFDSVFNKSRYTWSWGSPDILPMFAKDASGDHVTVMCYPAHFEDFAGSNMMELDVWVLKHFKKFLESATTNETLWRQLHEDRVVFFLHLLGIDTNGHSNKPHSEEYTQNIKYVDYLVKEVVTTLDEFYNHDAGTAYIMTSDHGMTNWGSHGAGDAHETLTPLVVWGAGIRGPKHTTHTCGDFNDSFCDEWHLNERARSDVSQADVAPLMSFLIGAAFPVNSVGVLPLDYLAGSVEDKAEAIYTNAAQILSQYQVKMQQVKERTISFFFRPFPELSTATNGLLKNVQEQINTDRHQDAIHESQFLIDIALRGLRYYQTYDRSFLGFSITLGFLGWIGYVWQLLVAEYTPAVLEFKQFRLLLDKKTSDQRVVRMFGVLAFLVTLLLAVQSLPWTNYLYCLVPVFLWMKIAQGWDLMYAAMKWAHDQTVLASVLTSVIVTLMGVEISVMCFFYRHLVSVGLVAIGLWAVTTPLWKTHKMTCWCWTGSCVAVAIFPLLPVVGSNSCTPLVLLAGVLTVAVGCFILTRLCKGAVPGHLDTVTKTVLAVQVVMAVLATLIVKITTDRIAEKSGSYFSTQLLSWLMFSVSPLLPLLTGVGLEVRLFSLALAFLVQYILLSITYEGLFLLFFMFLLYSWYRMESNLTHFTVEQGGSISSFRADIRSTCLRHSLARAHCHLYDDRTSVDKKDVKLVTRHLELADLRRAFFYIFFIVTGFFGTGNIASINSFDPASVYCFLTVFNPFIMGALMMTKVLLPFMVVTCMLRTVQMVTRAPLHGLMLLVSMLSSLMGLNFFFLVRDYGSWLEIGTSISHYVITMSITVFVSILIGLSQVLTSGSIPLSLMTKTD